MRKEVILAILSGSALGLIIAFGAWRANQAFKSSVKPVQKEEQRNVGKVKEEFNLIIAQPENYFVSVSSEVELQGLTRPNTFIVASTESEDKITRSDSKGSFLVKVDLSGGINKIKITSLDPQNGTSKKIINIIYSSEFRKFIEVKTENDKNESTTEGESVREKVKEKLAEAVKKPTAYVGIVTDITENTIQIKDEAGEILQVSLDSSIELVKTGSVAKKVELKDLAIGDYILALGFKNGNGVLTGKRIIITANPEEIKHLAVLGETIFTAKKQMTVKDNQGKEWSVEFGKKWDGPNLKEVEEGQRVIVIGIPSDSTLSLTRTLFLVE